MDKKFLRTEAKTRSLKRLGAGSMGTSYIAKEGCVRVLAHVIFEMGADAALGFLKTGTALGKLGGGKGVEYLEKILTCDTTKKPTDTSSDKEEDTGNALRNRLRTAEGGGDSDKLQKIYDCLMLNLPWGTPEIMDMTCEVMKLGTTAILDAIKHQKSVYETSLSTNAYDPAMSDQKESADKLESVASQLRSLNAAIYSLGLDPKTEIPILTKEAEQIGVLPKAATQKEYALAVSGLATTIIEGVQGALITNDLRDKKKALYAPLYIFFATNKNEESSKEVITALSNFNFVGLDPFSSMYDLLKNNDATRAIEMAIIGSLVSAGAEGVDFKLAKVFSLIGPVAGIDAIKKILNTVGAYKNINTQIKSEMTNILEMSLGNQLTAYQTWANAYFPQLKKYFQEQDASEVLLKLDLYMFKLGAQAYSQAKLATPNTTTTKEGSNKKFIRLAIDTTKEQAAADTQGYGPVGDVLEGAGRAVETQTDQAGANIANMIDSIQGASGLGATEMQGHTAGKEFGGEVFEKTTRMLSDAVALNVSPALFTSLPVAEKDAIIREALRELLPELKAKYKTGANFKNQADMALVLKEVGNKVVQIIKRKSGAFESGEQIDKYSNAADQFFQELGRISKYNTYLRWITQVTEITDQAEQMANVGTEGSRGEYNGKNTQFEAYTGINIDTAKETLNMAFENNVKFFAALPELLNDVFDKLSILVNRNTMGEELKNAIVDQITVKIINPVIILLNKTFNIILTLARIDADVEINRLKISLGVVDAVLEGAPLVGGNPMALGLLYQKHNLLYQIQTEFQKVQSNISEDNPMIAQFKNAIEGLTNLRGVFKVLSSKIKQSETELDERLDTLRQSYQKEINTYITNQAKVMSQMIPAAGRGKYTMAL